MNYILKNIETFLRRLNFKKQQSMVIYQIKEKFYEILMETLFGRFKNTLKTVFTRKKSLIHITYTLYILFKE